MKKPPKTPSIIKSNSTRQTAGMLNSASNSCGVVPASPTGEWRWPGAPCRSWLSEELSRLSGDEAFDHLMAFMATEEQS